MGSTRAVLSDIDSVFFELVDHFGEYGVSPRFQYEIKLSSGLDGPLDRLVERGLTILGITNQPDIARGKITTDFLSLKHTLLLAKYPQVAKVFVCEHDDGDLCDCRKPKPGLLLQAAKEFSLDLSKCWVVGDLSSDVEAGIAANARTVFVQTKYNAAEPIRDIATLIAKGPVEAFSIIDEIEEQETTRESVFQ